MKNIYKVIAKNGKIKTYRYKGCAMEFWFREWFGSWESVIELDLLLNKTFFEIN